MPSPIQECPLKEEKQNPKLHWIKFKLQDDEGKPMSDIAVNITLPDGSMEEKISDKDGLIEIKNVQPGNCKIESNWKEYTVRETVFFQ